MAIVTSGNSVRRGADFPKHQPRDSFSGGEGKGRGKRVVRVDYDGSNSSWAANIPDDGAAHPAASWLKFKNYDLTQASKMGNVADLVLNYEQDEFSQTPTEIPDDEITESGALLEGDVVKHPKFDTANPDWGGFSMRDFYDYKERRILVKKEVPDEYIDEKGETQEYAAAGETVPLEIRGMDKYMVGTGMVTVVEYSANEPASVILDGGKREVPQGMPGTVDNWLIMSARKARRGAWWVTEYVYQLSVKAISGFVYDDK